MNTKVHTTTVNEYDADNRLSKATITSNGSGESGSSTTFTQENLYNGEGQRIQKTEGANETNYFYQDGVVSYTTEGSTDTKAIQNLLGVEGNVIAAEENVPAADKTANDSLKYYLYNKDIQGSTTSILNKSGAGELSYEYDDFGETEINGSGTFGNEICYTGGIYDASTGLYYLNARYYDPENGRFLTEDTYRGELKEPDTLHLYAYCKNNPVNYVDPSGHVVVSVGFKAEAAMSIGVFGMLSLNTDFKYITVCLTAGLKMMNNALIGVSTFVNIFGYKSVDSLKGWGLSIAGSLYIPKKNYSGTIGLDISSKGIINGHVGGSIGGGKIACKILCWDVECGKTRESFRWKLSNVSKKKKTYKVKSQKITLQKKSNYVEVYMMKKKILIYPKKRRVKL